ncbi:MAG: hypothetical protein Kow00129_15940 [Thermoleophilia bacterium]
MSGQKYRPSLLSTRRGLIGGRRSTNGRSRPAGDGRLRLSRRRLTHILLNPPPSLVVMATSAAAWWTTGNVNYPAPAGPVYAGCHANGAPARDGRIVVVTYNLRFGEEVAQAVLEFSRHPRLQTADIVLLQEMDATSTEAMAAALGYDYVYFPASRHQRTGRDFGNAILSRGRLENPHKVVLPHLAPHNGQMRIAAGAATTAEGVRLTVYSAHLETQILGFAERFNQVEALVAATPPSGPLIIGGDFNTAPGVELRTLEKRLRAEGLVHSSNGVGGTWRLGPLEAALDHIFSRDFGVIDAGASFMESSDHRAVWVELELPPSPDTD